MILFAIVASEDVKLLFVKGRSMVLNLRRRLRELFDAKIIVQVIILYVAATIFIRIQRISLPLTLLYFFEENAQAFPLPVQLSRAFMITLLAFFHEAVTLLYKDPLELLLVLMIFASKSCRREVVIR